MTETGNGTGTGTGTGDGDYNYDLTAGSEGVQMAKDLTINVNIKINNKEYGASDDDYYGDYTGTGTGTGRSDDSFDNARSLDTDLIN